MDYLPLIKETYQDNWTSEVYEEMCRSENFRGRSLSLKLNEDLESVTVKFGENVLYVPTSLSTERTAKLIQEAIDQFIHQNQIQCHALGLQPELHEWPLDGDRF